MVSDENATLDRVSSIGSCPAVRTVRECMVHVGRALAGKRPQTVTEEVDR